MRTVLRLAVFLALALGYAFADHFRFAADPEGSLDGALAAAAQDRRPVLVALAERGSEDGEALLDLLDLRSIEAQVDAGFHLVRVDTQEGEGRALAERLSEGLGQGPPSLVVLDASGLVRARKRYPRARYRSVLDLRQDLAGWAR